MALSCQRDTTISASLIKRGNLFPANGTEVPLQLTAEKWLCPANRRKKSTGATVLVEQWAALCPLLVCSLNGTRFLFVGPSFYMPPCPQKTAAKGDVYYLGNVTPFLVDDRANIQIVDNRPPRLRQKSQPPKF